MRSFFLTFLFVVSVFSVEIHIDEKIPIPQELKQNIISYWRYRAKRVLDKTYEMELPYLQYLHSKEWYMNFFQNAPLIKKVEFKKIKRKAPYSYLFFIGIVNKKEHEAHYLYDKWILVDKKWYHKFNDNPLPPLGQ